MRYVDKPICHKIRLMSILTFTGSIYNFTKLLKDIIMYFMSY